VFKLHFGRLTGKAYTKGGRVLRFDAIAHNTAELRRAGGALQQMTLHRDAWSLPQRITPPEATSC
jgi:hypothetical protein